ncbi:MAG: hypothetical protein NUV77_07820 [Thermoguttaceae bacterium]|jgi:hypothetical protein|nr:hypothetical protein [Thermoguttaceae bacterium]
MRSTWMRQGLAAYGITTAIVVIGVYWGLGCFRPAAHSRSPEHFPPTGNRFHDALVQWDGQWYMEIAARGYRYDPERPSSVAFFPLYPLLGRAMATATGLSVGWALLAVSHLALMGAFVLFAAYANMRGEGEPPERAALALLAFGLFPTTFFARVAYSESLFLFLSLLALVAMRRDWPAWAIAAVIGLATAARSVGVALLLPFAMHLVRQTGWSWRTAGRWLALAPLALWGLLAYMAYLGLAEGEPLAFAKAQRHWQMRPPTPLAEKTLAYLSWEPIWSVYDSSSAAHWRRFGDNPLALASLQAANPVLFVLAVALVALGAARRWLTAEETLLAAGLLLIPYLLRGYDMAMTGQGRFVAVVVPIYLVLGRLLAHAPRTVAGVVVAGMAFYLGLYAAMFAAGYFFV